MAKKSSGLYRSFALVGSLSWTFIVCVILGAFLGTFIDNTFRVEPAFLIVGIIAGVVVGMWQSYRTVMKAIGPNEREHDDNR